MAGLADFTLFVGLGNPGPEYAFTRHNVGFLCVEEIAERHGFAPWKSRFQGLYTDGRIGGQKVGLLKPQTFMNRSGTSVSEAVRFYKAPVDQVFVFYDELDLNPGKLRVKQGGGNGGHNGLKSIDAHIKRDYWRVRVGIGHPGHKDRVNGHVLGRWSKDDQKWLDQVIPDVGRASHHLLEDDKNLFVSTIMQAFVPPKPAAKPANQTTKK